VNVKEFIWIFNLTQEDIDRGFVKEM